ncbi:MAG: winged helix-turn-helix transcriptional regulator [Verrucomicrobiae bacterium]|nr:winged helix-turn-helix transcriptional regulator [Verrucomicrobiae bacterium]
MPRNTTKKLNRAAIEKVAEVFRVFSEPTRLQILQELRDGPHSVNELVESLETSQANVSKQLRILYEAGVLAKEKCGTQVFYSIEDDIVVPLCELVCDKLNRDATAQKPVFSFSI